MKKILVLILIFSFFGCKVRDVRKSNIEEKQSEKIENSVVQEVKKEVQEDKKIEQKEQTLIKDKSSEISLTAIDTTKPIKIIDEEGKSSSYFNAVVNIKSKSVETKKDKQIKDNSTVKTQLNAANKQDNKIVKEKQIKQQNKEVHSKPALFSLLIPYLFLFFILLILYLIWRYQKKIPYIKNFFS